MLNQTYQDGAPSATMAITRNKTERGTAMSKVANSIFQLSTVQPLLDALTPARDAPMNAQSLPQACTIPSPTTVATNRLKSGLSDCASQARAQNYLSHCLLSYLSGWHAQDNVQERDDKHAHDKRAEKERTFWRIITKSSNSACAPEVKAATASPNMQQKPENQNTSNYAMACLAVFACGIHQMLPTTCKRHHVCKKTLQLQCPNPKQDDGTPSTSLAFWPPPAASRAGKSYLKFTTLFPEALARLSKHNTARMKVSMPGE